MKKIILLLMLLPFLLILNGCSDGNCRYSSSINLKNSLEDHSYTDAGMGGSDFVIMSRNLYLGANISDLLSEDNIVVLLAMTGELLEDIIDSEFPRRAEAVAREIEETDADIIGLQEVVLVRTGEYTFFQDMSVNADCVEYDFLASLLKSLERRGLSYKAAVISENADIELTDLEKDIRITDRDVILVKSELTVSNTFTVSFTNFLAVSVTGFPDVNVSRGFCGAQVTDGINTLHVINTHLEVILEGDATIQSAQGTELASYINSNFLTDKNTPVVITGDFNSGPNASSTATYDIMMALSGMTDSWISSGIGGDGNTCCFSSDLTGDPASKTKRIDHVFFAAPGTSALTTDGAMTTQDSLKERIYRTDDNRIWASDHGGILAGVSFGSR